MREGGTEKGMITYRMHSCRVKVYSVKQAQARSGCVPSKDVVDRAALFDGIRTAWSVEDC